MTAMETRTLSVTSAVGGPVELSIIEAGRGGRPLLLVHGFTGAKEDFADHADAFAADGWWVVAPDLRGHGASAAPTEEDAYSLDIFAADVDGLVGALGWSRFVLLGHSMGGMIAQVVALADPARLDGLILMDTSPSSVTLDAGLVELGVELARTGGTAAIKAALDELGSDAPLGSDAFERVVRERPGYREFCDRKLLGAAPAMYAAMLVGLNAQADRLASLAALAVPTLILVGDQDESFLAPAQAMAKAMPGSEHVVIPDAGHSPQFENPDAWSGAVGGFLARLG